MTRCLVMLALLFAGLANTHAEAASLSVSPIRLDLIHPGNTTRLTVRNTGERAITAQVRVFQWSAVNGKDNFTETRNVVVSPPIASIAAGAEMHVRLLRTSTEPVQGEENYRVIVDQIPDANRVQNVGVTIAIRYALPFFVVSTDATKPQITWSVRMIGGKRTLVATNTGDVHLRIANLTIGNLKIGKGLQGYVLGRSSRNFDLPRNANPGGALSADTDQGKLNATLAR